MKSILKIVTLLSLLLTFSCDSELNSKDSTINIKNNELKSIITNDDVLLYNNLTKLDLESQSVAFATLNPNQRYNLWMLKLENFEKNNNLISEEINFINDLKSVLKVSLFTDEKDKNPEKLNFIANKRDLYMSRAIELFGKNEGRYLLTKFENINQTIDKLKNGQIPNNVVSKEGPLKSCRCADDNECYRLTGISTGGLSWEYGTCNYGSCYVPTYVFGLWESSNTGRCGY